MAAGILAHPSRHWVISVVGAEHAPAALALGGLALDIVAPIILLATPSDSWVQWGTQAGLVAFHLCNTALFGVSGKPFRRERAHAHGSAHDVLILHTVG